MQTTIVFRHIKNRDPELELNLIRDGYKIANQSPKKVTYAKTLPILQDVTAIRKRDC